MGSTCCKGPERSHSEPDDDTIKFLAQVQLFRRLPVEFHPTLASLSQKVEFCAGEAIIQQGEEGTEFFIIMSGTADVQVEGKTVATLKVGDYFGEYALLRDEPRNATIIANTVMALLKITREQFRRLGLQERVEFPKRGAVGGGNNKEIKVKTPCQKNAQERKLMENAMQQNANVKTMVDLQSDQMNALIDIAWKEIVANGTEIIKQGDLDADYFYIVQDGAFEVLVSGQGGKSAEQAAAAVTTITQGGSFGELALLYVAPRAATVKASMNSTVWVMDRKNFKDILLKAGTANTSTYIQHLRRISLLSSLKDEELSEIAANLELMTFSRGEVVMQQGEAGQNFYILISGQVSIVKDGQEQTKLAGSTQSPSIFGEMALLNNEPRTATVKVVSESAKALTLDRESFDMLLGPLEEIKQRGKMGKSKVGCGTTRPAVATMKRGNIKKKDLQRLGLLGCGGFGAVELVEHVPTGNTYALKALSKGYLIKSGMQQSVMNEKQVQLLCDSHFIVNLYETYNGEQSLYFLLELALGGEIYATYNKKDLFGKEPHAKFYVAGVVFAFDHMHARKIIFRDLKPENLLLNELGQIKLTDMGLAKVCAGKSFTTCGTPDYFAPELIQSSGHTRALDWWTLGVLNFEFLVGRPPFESATPMQIYQKVIKGINKVSFPKKAKPAEDLIKALCKADPSERLPMKKGGIANVQGHNWYGGFDWEGMNNLTLGVPYKPTVKGKKDIANFQARKEDMPPHVPYKDPKTGWDKDFATSS